MSLLPLIGLISRLGSIVGLTGGSDATGVWRHIYGLTHGGVRGVAVGLVTFHLPCVLPFRYGGIVGLLVLVALGFQTGSLLFESKKFLLVLDNLVCGGTGAGNLDDGVTQLVVGSLGLTDHNLLRGEILEVVGI